MERKNNKDIKVIALTGGTMSGKDAAGWLLQTYYGAIPLKLAAPLKGMVFQHNALSWLPQLSCAARRHLQLLGDHVRKRNVHTFSKLLYDCITYRQQSHKDTETLYVITDMRYPDEYNFFNQKFGDNLIVIRVVNKHAPSMPQDIFSHPSETEHQYIPHDYAIYWSSIPELYETLRNIADNQLDLKPQYVPFIYFASNITKTAPETRLMQAVIMHTLKSWGLIIENEQAYDSRYAYEYEERILKGGLKEAAQEIFVTDMMHLASSNALIAYLAEPSVGCGYEIAVAKMMGKPIAVYTHSRAIRTHPFIVTNALVCEMRFSEFERRVKEMLGINVMWDVLEPYAKQYSNEWEGDSNA